MDYKRIYNQLIEKALKRNESSLECFEKHHIVPRCIGGKDEKSNIVALTPKEHFVAHKLLAKAYKDKSLRYAYNMMVFTTLERTKKKNTLHRTYKVSSREYEECRKFAAEEAHRKFKGRIYINNGLNQKCGKKASLEKFLKEGWAIGKLPLSAEVLDSIREKAKQRVLSEQSHNTKSKSMSSEKNPSFQTKIVHREGINKRVKIEELEKFLKEGWTLGMICNTRKERSKRMSSKVVDKANVKGKIYVHTEEKPFLVRLAFKEDLDFYLNVLHWKLGRGEHFKECKQENYRLVKIFMFNKALCKTKRVPIELKELYLSRGWIEGKGNFYKKQN